MLHNKIEVPVVQTLDDYYPKPIVDKSVENVIYRGYAPIGTNESFLGWRIEKETTTNGITKVEYAEGSMDYKFSWTLRANYSYSR